MQRRFATPVPRVRDLDELNMYFCQRCEAEHERTVQSTFGPFQIGTRFAEEKVAATPLPKYPFDLCVIRPAVRWTSTRVSPSTAIGTAFLDLSPSKW